MLKIENYLPPFQERGNLATRLPIIAGHSNTATVTTTATLTALQAATGYVVSTCTGTAAMTLTLPTGTLLGTQLGAIQGDTTDLFIDNSGGLATITIAASTNAVLSSMVSTGTIPVLTVATGATGVGRFTLMFTSPTAYTFSRTA